MDFVNTDIQGLLIIQPKIFEDQRGYFFESFNQKEYLDKNLDNNFIQDNQSKSCYGVIRGLHYQMEPYAQTKLVRVLQGKIFDVAVDIRINSPTYGKYFGIELSCENKKQLYIPKGFAHGFSVLSETAIVFYKCDCLYSPPSERGINIFDNQLNIDWKINKEFTIVSAKDKVNPGIKDAENNFYFNL
jgi:dTDP-4-dehydrorhamnose 3,5-epimerase